jgi:hypothetical protein
MSKLAVSSPSLPLEERAGLPTEVLLTKVGEEAVRLNPHSLSCPCL